MPPSVVYVLVPAFNSAPRIDSRAFCARVRHDGSNPQDFEVSVSSRTKDETPPPPLSRNSRDATPRWFNYPRPGSFVPLSPLDHGDGFDERRRRLYIEAAVCRAGIVGEEARSLRGYLARRILGEGGSGPRDLRGQKRWVGKRNRGVIRVRDRCTAQRATMFRG